MSGVRSRVLAFEANRYLIREINGKARLNYIDENSKMDNAELGDEVLDFATEDWYAADNKNRGS
jgi:hypothetical protein